MSLLQFSLNKLQMSSKLQIMLFIMLFRKRISKTVRLSENDSCFKQLSIVNCSLF